MIDLRGVLAVDRKLGMDWSRKTVTVWLGDTILPSSPASAVCPGPCERNDAQASTINYRCPAPRETTGDGNINLHSLGKLVPKPN